MHPMNEVSMCSTGAAIAFDGIHVEFRSYVEVNDQYCFSLFASFLRGLDVPASSLVVGDKRVDSLREDFPLFDKLDRVLNHLRRAMIFSPNRRSRLADDSYAGRRKAVEGVVGQASLENFVEWLFKQTFRPARGLAVAGARKRFAVVTETLKSFAEKVEQVGTMEALIKVLCRENKRLESFSTFPVEVSCTENIVPLASSLFVLFQVSNISIAGV